MDELTQLIDASFDDTLDAQGRAELEQLLERDPHAARCFARRSLMHRLLLDRHALQAYREGEDVAEATTQAKRWHLGTARWAAAAAIVASVLLIYLTYSWQTIRREPIASAKSVGVLVASSDARWVSDLINPGDELTQQTLHIASGTVELQCASGATLKLLGPAEMKLINPMRVELRSGRVHVSVPKGVSGFTVVSGGWSAVDIGTVFGVSAVGGRLSDLYVYDGRVVLTSPTGQYSVVEAGRAMHASGNTATPESAGDTGLAKLLVDSVVTDPTAPTAAPELALWLAADHGVQGDAAGRITQWRDVRDVSDMQAEPDKADEAPVWVADGINNRPAVRFDGHAELRLPTAQAMGLADSDYEMFIVARCAEGPIQYLIAGADPGGYEEYELHVNSGSGVRFIPDGPGSRAAGDPAHGYADLAAPNAFAPTAHLFAARVAGGLGVVDVDGVDGGAVVARQPRSDYGGALQLGMRSGRTLGLHGAIAEVLIYRTALTAGQRAVVMAYLGRKYKLDIRQPKVGAGEEKPVRPAAGGLTP